MHGWVKITHIQWLTKPVLNCTKRFGLSREPLELISQYLDDLNIYIDSLRLVGNRIHYEKLAIFVIFEIFIVFLMLIDNRAYYEKPTIFDLVEK